MITLTSRGLFCEEGGFHIDPSGKVDVALITHAHSDHARSGSKSYYCVESGQGLLEHRIGRAGMIHPVRYGEKFKLGKTWVSFHPAGHILGSAQIRIEHGSEVWVASGDYKREPDPTCDGFEVVPCDTFITEATFGNPRYEWVKTPAQVSREIFEWWQENARKGENSLLFAYALGKCQRILSELLAYTGQRALVFGEAADLTERYRERGVPLLPTERLERMKNGKKLTGELIIAPHSIMKTGWYHDLCEPSTAFASGWMGSSAGWMRGRYDRGFTLSDHADWPALLRTIRETGARRIFVLHASDTALVRHLRMQGIQAAAMTKDQQSAPPHRQPQEPVQGDLFAGWDA